jgi:tRNA pseudouridine55 synthase
MTDGVLILDKPAGVSSARAVSQVKRLLGGRTRLGHAGTLDPFATGVLVLLVGRATRECEKIMNLGKMYEATIQLGATTDTDDTESPARTFPDAYPPPALMQVQQALGGFIGAIEQRPPAYSAIKVGGRRACDLVREGQLDLQLQPRIVQVHSIEVLCYQWPLLSVRIECGRGTYIRAIARDVGMALHVGGYLTALRRTRIGQYTAERAVRLEELNAETVWSHVLPLLV